MARVFLQLQQDSGGSVRWFVPGTRYNEGDIQAAADWLDQDGDNNQVVVLVPGEDVLLTSSVIPGTGKKRLQALPYALEENLADDLEQLHIVPAQTVNGHDRIAAAVVARSKMQQWLELLQQHGIYPEAMVPDVLALPYHDNTWSLYQLDERYLLRTGACSGVVVDADNISLALQLALEDESLSKPQQLHVYGNVDESVLRRLPAELDTVTSDSDNMAAILGKQYRRDQATNLMQGEFAVNKPGTHEKRTWRTAVALLLAWLVIESGMTLIDNLRLTSTSEQLRQDITAVYLEAFPGTRNVPNPRLMMERRLQEILTRGQGGGFLAILSGLGQALNAAGSYTMERITYGQEVMDVFIILETVAQLESLKKRLLQNREIATEVKNARTENNQVYVHLRMRGGS